MRRRTVSLFVVVLPALLLAACGDEIVSRENLPPDTGILAGPVEGSSTSYRVFLAWTGEDPDGRVAGYEYEWDLSGQWTPTASEQEEFTVTADPVAGGRMPSPGFHTFRVRAVDDDGAADPTPASRSFNATSVAPRATIVSGPPSGGSAAPYVRFEMDGTDDDGSVVAYRWALLTREEFYWDTTNESFTTARALQWADTLTYHPLPSGGYDTDRPAWVTTSAPEVVFPSLSPVTFPGFGPLYIFLVRAVDDAGVQQPDLSVPENARLFLVRSTLAGPDLVVSSDELDHDWSGYGGPVVAFSSPVRFHWSAVPGASGLPVDAFSWAWDDSSSWSPWSGDTQYPPDGGKVLLTPGTHRLFVRAREASPGFTRTITAWLDVHPGPQSCPPQDRSILVVLDTDDNMWTRYGVLPPGYAAMEQSLAADWLPDHDIRIHVTNGGRVPVDPTLLSCASTVVWIHTAAPQDGDTSLLSGLHRVPINYLASYLAAGGNLILCGVQPAEAVRYFRVPAAQSTRLASYPLPFTAPPAPDLAPHWLAAGMGVAAIDTTIGHTFSPSMAALRLRTATSQASGYPDLPFDVLSWPDGPAQRGFGFYDRGVHPTADAEVLYTINGSGPPVAVRRLTSPAAGGNAIYLGLHPYFIERPAFRAFLAQALTDFGETPRP